MSGGPFAADVRHVRSVLFVCMGNICRSPLAQGVFEHLAAERGVRDRLTIESRGTGDWHVGEEPDPRARQVALANGVRLSCRARVLEPEGDSARFDLLLAMDRQNLANMLRRGCPPDRTVLFLSFHPAAAENGILEVPDPYYGGPEGFDDVYRLVLGGAQGLLNAIFPDR